MKFWIATLGCKVNQSESDIIEGNLIRWGHRSVSLSEDPTYCIINTCTVTAKSDYQSRQLIRRALRTRANVIVTGCYAQMKRDDIVNIDPAIRIVNNNEKISIIGLIEHRAKDITLYYSSKARPKLKVQDGCDRNCTYCIVPSARGKSRSTSQSVVIDQINKLQSAGYHEVVLTGVRLGAYGRDLYPKQSLSDLISNILNNCTIDRIRLSSLAINEIDDELVELIGDRRICRHLHVPLQSGDDTILKRMRRPYDTRLVRRKLTQICERYPEISLGTDIIVGFPGETQDAFQNTKKLLEDLPFSYFHIFPFSERSGTAAAEMPNRIPRSIVKNRCDELNEINIAKKEQFLSKQIGRLVDVILEDLRDKGMVGTSSNYLKVYIPSLRSVEKTLITVRVTERVGTLVWGEPVDSS